MFVLCTTRDAQSGGGGRRRGAAPNQRRLTSKSDPHRFVELGDKISGTECPKFGAEGALLEHFSNFSEKLFLKNAIKSKIFDMIDFEKIFVFFRFFS